MSAAITAVVLAAGAGYMQYEQTRQAKKEADKKIEQEKLAFAADESWKAKKKGINDANASRMALRLRDQGAGSGGATDDPTAAPAVGNSNLADQSQSLGASPMLDILNGAFKNNPNLLGMFGGRTGGFSGGVNQAVKNYTNSPLGL